VRDTSLYGRADIQHGDRGQFTSRNSVFTSITNLPARSLLNLRLGMAFSRYDISVYAQNVLNERNPVIQAPLGTITEDVSQQPRLYGVAVRATF
jgi:outer membrane receptor protein involved in Fe transport